MSRRRALAALAILLATGAISGCSRDDQSALRSFYATLNPQGDFALTDQDGHPFHLKDQRGQVVLLFFGYLSCPDICPTTLSKLSAVYARLGPKLRPKVLTVFVSVDTQRDTPKRMKEYLSYFNVNAVGLTGSENDVRTVAASYKATYIKHETHSALGYLYDHSDSVYLIDPVGRVQDELAPDEKADSIADKIRRLL